MPNDQDFKDKYTQALNERDVFVDAYYALRQTINAMQEVIDDQQEVIDYFMDKGRA